MKQSVLLLMLGLSLSGISQNMQVQNMASYLRNKEYDKAKVSADAAAVHESTSTSPKMWSYRGNIYFAIYTNPDPAVKKLDSEAEEKALDAYTNCFKFDKDKIYAAEIKSNFINSVSATLNKADVYKENKQYDQANKCYELIESALPYETESLKQNHITDEMLMFEKYDNYQRAGNTDKAKEYAHKLMDMKYRDPKLYSNMMNQALKEKDTAAALNYIEKGKAVFPDHMLLIATEIDIYLARKNTSVLKEKLDKAISVDPKNDVLYAVLAQVYEKDNDLVNAEKYYLKAVEIKPESENVNYNLGKLYFNTAVDYNKKMNDLKPSETAKNKEYEEKVKENFRKAIPYLEKAYSINPDMAYKQRLRQIHLRLGEADKAAKYK